MRKPVVDYRRFRPGMGRTPEFAHLRLLWGWVFYFALYLLTENLIPPERCVPMHLWVDDVIPFREWFVIPYVFWYFLVGGSLVYFLLYNIGSFRRLQIYLIVTQVLGMTICILFPNRQDLRPAVFPRDNALSRMVGLIYRIDTSTGVCPSFHVAFSLAVASVWLREKDVPPAWKAFVLICAVLICLSTMFIKQHSAADVLCAMPVCLAAEIVVRHIREPGNSPPRTTDL